MVLDHHQALALGKVGLGRGLVVCPAVVDELGAVGADRELPRGDGQGAGLDKDGVIFGEGPLHLISNGEGQGIGGGAAIPQRGGRVHRDLMAAHKGGGGVHGKQGMGLFGIEMPDRM